MYKSIWILIKIFYNYNSEIIFNETFMGEKKENTGIF